MPFYIEKFPRHLAVASAIYKRCWIPKRCAYSKKFLWFRKAYFVSGYNIILESTHPVVYTWIDRDTFITLKLKGAL